MAVKLRLMRMGRRHKPFFRLNAIDTRTPRDGKIIEKLGHYDPIEKDPAKQLVLKKERIEYWLGVGAVPSETVAELISKIGIESEHYKHIKARRKRARLVAKKKGVPFDNTQRLLAKKAAEKAAAEKPADAAAAKPAEKPAEKAEKQADKK
jgi:small subunit ribosomal protein S16